LHKTEQVAYQRAIVLIYVEIPFCPIWRDRAVVKQADSNRDIIGALDEKSDNPTL